MRHFFDGDNEGRRSHTFLRRLRVVDIANLVVRVDHGFFEAGVHKIDFIRSVSQESAIGLRNLLSHYTFEGANQFLISDFFQMFLQSAEPHV